MSGGEIAALIAAGAFLMLVLVLCVPIYRLRHTVDAATRAINDLNDAGRRRCSATSTRRSTTSTPRSTQVHTSLDGVNLQLMRVDTITGHAANVTRERGQPRHRGHLGRVQPAGQGRRVQLRRAPGRQPAPQGRRGAAGARGAEGAAGRAARRRAAGSRRARCGRVAAAPLGDRRGIGLAGPRTGRRRHRDRREIRHHETIAVARRRPGRRRARRPGDHQEGTGVHARPASPARARRSAGGLVGLGA